MQLVKPKKKKHESLEEELAKLPAEFAVILLSTLLIFVG
jgi:hypothetical protein